MNKIEPAFNFNYYLNKYLDGLAEYQRMYEKVSESEEMMFEFFEDYLDEDDPQHKELLSTYKKDIWKACKLLNDSNPSILDNWIDEKIEYLKEERMI